MAKPIVPPTRQRVPITNAGFADWREYKYRYTLKKAKENLNPP